MKTGQPTITESEEVVEECNGCNHAIKSIRNKTICTSYIYPRICWWFNQLCPDATHIEHKMLEDPIKEP